MKTKLVLILALVLGLAFTACTTTNSTVDTFGPLVAQIANARIAKSMLDKNPSSEAKLVAISAALDAIQGADLQEITANAITAFVDSGSEKWGLLPGEKQLLTAGLLAARDQFIRSTGTAVVMTNDPRVGVWISAIRLGIDEGIAAHKSK